jgi:predicted secreted hydrolase
VDRGRFRHAERLRRAAGGLAGFETDRLEVWLEDWWLRLDDGEVVRLVAGDPGAGVGVDLALAPSGPLVRHGRDGYSRKGNDPGNASVYLSWPDLEVTGTLTLDGRRRSLSGSAWYDHEWGTSQLGRSVVGWDWFGLRLGDGRALMVYRLRRQDGRPDPQSSGTLVRADGGAIALAVADFELEVLESWTSPHTGADYPARWRLRSTAHDFDLEVVPQVADCEIDSSFSTGIIYWEGPVEATGTASGEGYAELTGYAGTLEGRF